MRRSLLAFAVLYPFAVTAFAGGELPVVFKDDFTKGVAAWKFSDAAAWKIIDDKDGKKSLSQFQQSKVKTPHRSPFNMGLVKDVIVGDFVLEAKVKSTAKDVDHRDVCLFFGYQNDAHFYYVHCAKKMDDRANQIFIVDGADRKKISTKTTDGTPWDAKWHHIKVVRTVADGKIEVFFDDMKTPVKTATDKTFTWGQVGVGSFDDTAEWRDIVLRGTPIVKGR